MVCEIAMINPIQNCASLRVIILGLIYDSTVNHFTASAHKLWWRLRWDNSALSGATNQDRRPTADSTDAVGKRIAPIGLRR